MKLNHQQIAERLRQGALVAYPTEAVFGLGCDPENLTAVENLLALKQRDVRKGLILVAPTLEFLQKFVDFAAIPDHLMTRLTTPCERATTWIVPAQVQVSPLLRGQFSTIAIRLCSHPDVVKLCEIAQMPLVSTSANVSGQSPALSIDDVETQFGSEFPVLQGELGGATSPSQIRDLFTNQILR